MAKRHGVAMLRTDLRTDGGNLDTLPRDERRMRWIRGWVPTCVGMTYGGGTRIARNVMPAKARVYARVSRVHTDQLPRDGRSTARALNSGQVS